MAARTKKKKVLNKALDIKAPAAGDPNLQRKEAEDSNDWQRMRVRSFLENFIQRNEKISS